MARFATLGFCPLCSEPVYKDKIDVWDRVLDYLPISKDEVIPHLKARREVYYAMKFGRRITFTQPVIIWLVVDLKAGGALPTNLHGRHIHQVFEPFPPEHFDLPKEPPF